MALSGQLNMKMNTTTTTTTTTSNKTVRLLLLWLLGEVGATGELVWPAEAARLERLAQNMPTNLQELRRCVIEFHLVSRRFAFISLLSFEFIIRRQLTLVVNLPVVERLRAAEIASLTLVDSSKSL